MPPKRYNLRKKTAPVVWVDDDTLKTKDEDEDDSEFIIEDDDEDEEDETEEDTEDEDEAEDEDDTMGSETWYIPKGARVSVKLHIHTIQNMGSNRIDVADESVESDSEEDFIEHLMTKYVPNHKIGKKKAPKETKNDKPALPLNNEEEEYFDELPKSKKRKFNDQMKSLARLVKDGEVPQKFRVLGLPISDQLKASVIRKIDTLNEMEPDSGEVHKLRTWVEGFLRVPFGSCVPLPVDYKKSPDDCARFLSQTKTTLDRAVYGMDSAKTQIMQVVAQWIANPSSVGNVIALSGPPGTGKTTVAKHGIAEVLKRPFEFFSLGGASDVANFVGHSYTYEGATWGRIVDTIMSARCMNPVIYFDELDKVSTTSHGDEIISMLIHLTDRTQNSQFHDRYFAGVDFDLSQCLFVFSFNDETKVHPILKDRMRVINCPGYTADEKKIIVEQYVWPDILHRLNMSTELKISEDAIKCMIQDYSKEEEGVRTLIRAVETLVTRINLLRIADEATAKSYKFYMPFKLPMTITADHTKHILADSTKQVNESWRHIYV
jgi:ATP-dependent Lon protease